MTDFNQMTHDTEVGSHGGQSRQMMEVFENQEFGSIRVLQEAGKTFFCASDEMCIRDSIYADRVFVMDEGKVVMQGTPREIFSQVERLKHLRLDVPQVTLLAYELQKSGLKLPDGILTAQELTEELNKLCTGSKTGASDNRQMP